MERVELSPHDIVIVIAARIARDGARGLILEQTFTALPDTRDLGVVLSGIGFRQ